MVILVKTRTRRNLGNVLAAAIGLALVAAATGSMACGYDKDDVSLERIGLSIVYPESLNVLAAMDGADTLDRPLSTSIVRQRAFSFYQTSSSLERLATKLAGTPAVRPLDSLTLVLVEPMLWTRLEIQPSKPGDPIVDDRQSHVSTQIHASGPRKGELLVVTGAKVIEHIARDRLAIAEAINLGVLRLYGSELQITAFKENYEMIGEEHVRNLVKTNG